MLIDTYKKELLYHQKQIKLIEAQDETFSLNFYEAMMLRIRGISKTDVEALHNIVYPTSISDLYQYIELLRNYIDLGVPSASLSINVSQYNYIYHSTNSCYYNYMAIMQKMPSKALETYKDLSKKWGNLPVNLHANCSSEDYEHLANIELEKTQEDLMALSGVVNMQQLMLDKEEEKLDTLINRHKRINDLKQEIIDKKDSLNQGIGNLISLQKRIIKDCEFDSSDDLITKWGKILRIATIMNDKIKTERTFPDLTPTLTSSDILNELNKRFERYYEEYPDDDLHIKAVECLYNESQKAGVPISGVLYMGTNTGEPHPILQIGDIILKRNNKGINSADDFREAKNLSSIDSLTFYRLIDGVLVEMTKENPKNDLLIGLQKIVLGD